MESQQQQQQSYVMQYLPQPTARSLSVLRHGIGIGITLILLGALSIIANVVGLVVNAAIAMFFFTGHGIWGGVLCIIVGAFGVAAGVHKSKCLTITFMVLAIITAVESLSLLIIAIIGVTYSPCTIDYGYRYGCGGYYSCLSYYPPCSDHGKTALAMECLLAICALVTGILCIIGSAVACKAHCCCSNTAYPNVMFVPYSGNQPIAMYPLQQPMQPTLLTNAPQVKPTNQPMEFDAAPPVYTLPQWPAAEAAGISPAQVAEY